MGHFTSLGVILFLSYITTLWKQNQETTELLEAYTDWLYALGDGDTSLHPKEFKERLHENNSQTADSKNSEPVGQKDTPETEL